MQQRIEELLSLPEGGAADLANETAGEVLNMAIESGARMFLGPLADAFLFCSKVRDIYAKAKEKALIRLEMLRKEARIAHAERFSRQIHQDEYRITEGSQQEIQAFLGITATTASAADAQLAAQEQALQTFADLMAQQEHLAAEQESQLRAMVEAQGPAGTEPDAARQVCDSVMEGHREMAKTLNSISAPQKAIIGTVAQGTAANVHEVLSTPSDLPPLPADVADPMPSDPLTTMQRETPPVRAVPSAAQTDWNPQAPHAAAHPSILPYLEKTKEWNIDSCKRFCDIINNDPDYAPYLVRVNSLIAKLEAADPAWFQSVNWIDELQKMDGIQNIHSFKHWIESAGRLWAKTYVEGIMGVEVDFLEITKRANIDICQRWLNTFAEHVDRQHGGQLLGLIEAQEPGWFAQHDWTELLVRVPGLAEYRFDQPGESMVLNELGLYRHIMQSGFGRFIMTPERMQSFVAAVRQYTRQFPHEIVAVDRHPIHYALTEAIKLGRHGQPRDNRTNSDTRFELATKLGIR